MDVSFPLCWGFKDFLRLLSVPSSQIPFLTITCSLPSIHVGKRTSLWLCHLPDVPWFWDSIQSYLGISFFASCIGAHYTRGKKRMPGCFRPTSQALFTFELSSPSSNQGFYSSWVTNTSQSSSILLPSVIIAETLCSKASKLRLQQEEPSRWRLPTSFLSIAISGGNYSPCPVPSSGRNLDVHFSSSTVQVPQRKLTHLQL